MTTIKPDAQNPLRILELESIRGIAALLIIFYHIPKWNPLLDIGIINNAYLIVELFFVLSGFVIYNAYADRISSVKDLLRFQFLRFGRLYPVHLLFLIAFIFIEVSKYFAQAKFGVILPNTQPFRENNLSAIIEQMFLVQAIGPTGNALTFNYVAWSISVEFYTYLVFGFILLVAAKTKNFVFLLLTLIIIILLGTNTTLGFEYLLRCLAGFFIGCLTALAVNRLKVSVPKYTSLLFIFFIIIYIHIKTSHEYDLVIYFLAAQLIACIVLTRNGYLNNLLKFQILTWLGSISYSLYMSHFIVIWLSNQFIRLVLKKPEILREGQSLPQLSNIETVTACLIIIVATLLVASLVYQFVERPMREKSRKIAFDKLS